MNEPPEHPEAHIGTDEAVALSLGGQLPAHVRGCTECTTRLEAWRTVRSAVLLAMADAAYPVVADGRGARWRRVRDVLAAQPRLTPRSFAPTAASLAAVMCLVGASVDANRLPVVLAVGMSIIGFAAAAVVVGRECDPRLELFQVLPTRPFVVLAARIAMVLAATVVLGTLDTLVLAGITGATSPTALLGAWVGPVVVVMCVAAAAGTVYGRTTALTTGAVLAFLASAAAISYGQTARLSPLTMLFQTDVVTVGTALCLVVAALWLVEVHPERIRS